MQLHALASATTLNQAAGAVTSLLDSALIYDLEREVFPAAVVAAPILLDIIEHAHPRARFGALDLLWEMLDLRPSSEFERVDTAQVPGLRLCCAIADHVRDRRGMLKLHGRPGQRVLTAAARHWRFAIQEVVAADRGGVLVLGTLKGQLPDGPFEAELHSALTIVTVPAVETEYDRADEDDEAFLRLLGTAEAAIAPGAVLCPTDCAEDQS
ncbi:hypothetical protein F4556_000104 [Kitasatospora gansuensis]|uniref:Uncharacterized protein n=1 Tax=Kitasatospora gansuensis TaxID=258050 RepID=A0A7W7S625_9ACTN|nr:hypothetical protein [Kitasatospora gansuensis]MBB4944569.1 hypothetical protein [Kitasatospora gansuensis]